jgi:predicted acylesterase/phospholipase RssA
MIDAADRARPRFPAGAERRVSAAIAAQLDQWSIGAGDLAVTQGACGTDLLVAEEAMRRGARSLVLLPAPVEDFIKSSVAWAGPAWVDRFHTVLDGSELDVQPDVAAEVRYQQNNERALRVGFARADPMLVLAVATDEDATSGGAGGFVAQALACGLDVTRIDPTRSFRLRDAGRRDRERSDDGPKRLPSLDGGGMRGLITMEILCRVEDLLGGGDPDYRLSDTFDYIAGTSTGAIIAAALARGDRVASVKEMYQRLGPKIFRKRWFPGWLRSLYKRGPITQELQDYFGESTQMGDESLRSLLMVVMHRTDTDSLWPLTNVSTARYNTLAAHSNLRLPIWQVIRGSTAAPFYFPPEEILLESSNGAQSRGLFQDGGITPFNNPAVLLFVMATSGRYGLRWKTGPDELLIVSVGTGSRPAVDRQLARRRTNAFFHARNLPNIFMNGSNIENARLCRVLGATRHAPFIDSEFDDPGVADLEPTEPLFSYVRYNALIAPRALEEVPGHPINAQRVAKLDAARVTDIDALERIGQRAANEVRLGHFAGFLP